ncbi:MAG: acetate--CoA ligase [Gammaproteobacteria bacterium 39-13]|nr:acetate--CoA ligase [Gammaproteobacteria bacterium]OJV88090.1 MAG: acetate--CoA ligase [Gammaproteobacteria bacterium 39-13]
MAGQSKKAQSDIFEPTLSNEKYQQLYQQSIQSPELFWAEQAERFITWYKTWLTVNESDFSKGEIKWFKGAKLNVSYNCLDRHLPAKAKQPAILWEGDNGERRQQITYQKLHEQVCRFANGLKTVGIKKGDRVCLYLPMIPEAVVAMLACARIGAVHSVVFAGFSSHALAERILDAGCQVVITADEGIRGGKTIPLKKNVDEALTHIAVRKIIVIKNSGKSIPMHMHRDIWYHELCRQQSMTCEPEWMDAEDPLFILYTSGSTGKPKGIVHTSGGYLTYAAITHRYVFDYQPNDIYWCTADIGWITGHTYSVYGPFVNGATTVMYEGVLTGPDPSLIWNIVDRYQVTIFYTAPTAIRSLMALGEEPLASSTRNSLRILGTVGEPINPEAWRWYDDAVGQKKCWIVDTWWQTETGGVMILPLPGIGSQKPGAACKPFFGINPAIVDAQGAELENDESGYLIIKQSWPGQARGIYKNPERFLKGYFSQYPGFYFTGDGAYRDSDGDYWITGRVDDVINVAGHRLGTAEIESALVLHPAVAEAAVVGVPHPVKGQGVYAYVTLIAEKEWNDNLVKELQEYVAKRIGKLAIPDYIQLAPNLPKTRSGKIMRRILRCVATGEFDKIGDTSTLADPEALSALVALQKEKK